MPRSADEIKTCAIFVDEYVKLHLHRLATPLENQCVIAILHQIDGISSIDARKAVLASMAAAAWHQAGLSKGEAGSTTYPPPV